MSLDGAHHANEPTLFDESAFDDYFGTPWLTGMITFATVTGTFVAALVIVLLLGRRARGSS